MSRTVFAKSVARRSVLGAVGASLAGLLIRPLQARAANGPPRRLLIVHRPCGTIPENFFPPIGAPKVFDLPAITRPFEPLRSDLVIASGVTCPRDPAWPGDQHAAGLICMVSGKRFIQTPGTSSSGDPNTKQIVAADASIDQYLAAQAPTLSAAGLRSLQSTAYLPSSGGLPSFRVMSYRGTNQPLFPEHDAAALFKSLFGNLSADDLTRQDDDKSVLDCVTQDLARLQDLIPASEKQKLDSHLAAIQSLEQNLVASGLAACRPPAQLPLPSGDGMQTLDEAQHLALAQNQLGIIQAAFQCDFARVASFTFAHGNSDLRFQKMVDGVPLLGGHHELASDTSAASSITRIDQVYSEQLAKCLQNMKAIPEGNGSLLDNTLVVYLSECGLCVVHGIENMPVLLFGAKNLGLQTGQHLDFGGRYMNDIWSAVCAAFGLDATFGDPAFGSGPVGGLFA